MKLIVGPFSAVPRLSGEHRPSHLVSWLSPGDAPPSVAPSLAPASALRIASHDIAEEIDGFTPPMRRHVAELLAFARGWDGRRPLLVHCWAGVSRSTAAAYAIACQARPDLAEAELAGRLRAVSPTATPNPRIVRLADDLLGRDGRMAAAVLAIGRGAECMEGEAFVLDLRR